MKTCKIILIVAALAAAGSAQAVGIGVRAGTTGIGGDVAWGVFPTLSARVGYSGGSYNTSTDTSNFKYDTKLKLQNVNAFLDWSPLGPFRLTGGFVNTKNRFDVHGTPNVGGGGSIDGEVKAGKSTAPYLGVGYGNVSGAGINFYVDLGVIMQGSPKASLTANCTAPGPACTTLQGQVATEQQNLQDKLDRFKTYPVLNIGLTIGF